MSHNLKTELLDLDSLDKGTVIPASLVSKVIGISTVRREYGLGLMRLKKFVIDHLYKERGLVVVVVSQRDSLVIHEDTNAAAECRRRRRVAIRSLRRTLVSMENVDATKLSQDDRRKHERATDLLSREIRAMDRERRPRPSPVASREVKVGVQD